MKHIIKGALMALALAAAPVIAAIPAVAATDFSITLGNAAFGFSDGYWDRDHHWHNWQNKNQAQYYRTHNGDHYVASRHDHDRKDHDQGWRNDRYWTNTQFDLACLRRPAAAYFGPTLSGSVELLRR